MSKQTLRSQSYQQPHRQEEQERESSEESKLPTQRTGISTRRTFGEVAKNPSQPSEKKNDSKTRPLRFAGLRQPR